MLHEWIKLYFHLGLPYKDRNALLAFRHCCIVSERHLKWILKSYRLFGCKEYASIDTVITFIEEQLLTSGQLHSYRWMHYKCVENGILVRKDVYFLLKELDPRGAELRRTRRGPNYIWHLDS
ncbi:hypothetical protein LDENG_00183670 [Lucifuga dentata]|nr:hypothetical protein LDENG_00183670 [Lucifuga dentata]